MQWSRARLFSTLVSVLQSEISTTTLHAQSGWLQCYFLSTTCRYAALLPLCLRNLRVGIWKCERRSDAHQFVEDATVGVLRPTVALHPHAYHGGGHAGYACRRHPILNCVACHVRILLHQELKQYQQIQISFLHFSHRSMRYDVYAVVVHVPCVCVAVPFIISAISTMDDAGKSPIHISVIQFSKW